MCHDSTKSQFLSVLNCNIRFRIFKVVVFVVPLWKKLRRITEMKFLLTGNIYYAHITLQNVSSSSGQLNSQNIFCSLWFSCSQIMVIVLLRKKWISHNTFELGTANISCCFYHIQFITMRIVFKNISQLIQFMCFMRYVFSCERTITLICSHQNHEQAKTYFECWFDEKLMTHFARLHVHNKYFSSEGI